MGVGTLEMAGEKMYLGINTVYKGMKGVTYEFCLRLSKGTVSLPSATTAHGTVLLLVVTTAVMIVPLSHHAIMPLCHQAFVPLPSSFVIMPSSNQALMTSCYPAIVSLPLCHQAHYAFAPL